MPQTSTALTLVDAEVLLSGPAARSLSPVETNALLAVQSTEAETQRLIGLVKDYSRAGTAAKTMAGINLRHIREYYYGPRHPNGGRPKEPETVSGYANWDAYLADLFQISSRVARNWMQMADAVEALAEARGLDLQSICRKLPWDWTPEEAAALDATVHQLTQDKTQRELLQSDFLTGLGYEAPAKTNGSNNPTGKNGGRAQAAQSLEESVRLRQEAARLTLFGTVTPGRMEKGSVVMFMENFIKTEGAEVAALPRQELRDLYEHTLMAFTAAFRKLAGI